MKRKILLVCALTVMMATPSLALEFQQMGNFGRGAGGAVHFFDDTAVHWNPGALAFHRDKTAKKYGASVGNGIDIKRAAKVDSLFMLEDPATGSLDLEADTATNLDRAGQTAQRIGKIGKMQQLDNNSLRLNGDAILGVRLRHFVSGRLGTL